MPHLVQAEHHRASALNERELVHARPAAASAFASKFAIDSGYSFRKMFSIDASRARLHYTLAERSYGLRFDRQVLGGTLSEYIVCRWFDAYTPAMRSLAVAVAS